MKRALVYASVASMIHQFNMDNIRLLLSMGYKVDVACNMEQGSSISQEKVEEMKKNLVSMGVDVYHIPVPRKITAVGDMVKSLAATKKLMDQQAYSLIHCHSPIGGMLCRLAGRMSKGYRNARMIYTAHGFHFYKGAPKINWLLYYPVERLCAHYTDVLITINQEDYALGKTFPIKKGGSVHYVPGIGIDLERIQSVTENRNQLCAGLGIDENACLMLSVGELNDNKNHSAVVQALPELPENVHYLICGQGSNSEMLQEMAAKLDCGNRLHILGFRNDVVSIMKSCDLFVFPSKREGLSVALMEAMACGMPCYASNIRGNVDLLEDAGGVLLNVDSFGKDLVREFGSVDTFMQYKSACKDANLRKIQGFSCAVVQNKMRAIYAEGL